MDKVKTGNLIKEARIKKGYTQREFGDIVGVTNKAVSRWENGDAFPDVALLDMISSTLELNIEEIVLGELKEKESTDVVVEIAQLARMEKNRKNRIITKLSLCIAPLLIFLILGMGSMINGINDMNAWIFYVGCVICTTGLCVYFIINKVYSFMNQDITSKVITIISGISSAYLILLIAGTFGLYISGVRLIAENNIGSFLNWQLIVIFLINIGVALLSIVRKVLMGVDINFGMYLSVASIFLSLSYSDLLHRLMDYKDFWNNFITNTAVVLGIVCLGIMVSWIATRKNINNNSLED